MTSLTRRDFIKGLGVAGATGLLGAAGCAGMSGKASKAHVVVVGGGPGGATCAKYLKRYDSNIRVTLIEPNPVFYTCFGSNWVLGGFRKMEDIGHGYDGLKSLGVEMVQDRVVGIDPAARTVALGGGGSVSYDRLVVAPGIDFRYETMEGISAADNTVIPHAWKAGEQTRILRSQLEAMPNGGVFVLIPPGNPFRCPPGPYERASLVAHYFKQAKPRSKVLILDPKPKFSKQGLFMEGWKELYGDMIEWVPGAEGGLVERIDVASRTAYTNGGLDSHKADVMNFIPAQKAGMIAHTASLADDSGWCPVDQLTFESTLYPHIHVIGDASIAGKMPKSGHSANSQGKLVAAAIVLALADQEMIFPSHVNTCYSLVAPDYGISVAAVYRLEEGSIQGVKGAGGVSPSNATETIRRQEALYAEGWYHNITADIFGA